MKTKKVIFSDRLEQWLKDSNTKSLQSLSDVFGQKSFVVFTLLLMIASALPIPTGGITNVFEIITMLISIEIIAGVKQIWIPRRWRQITLGSIITKRVMPRLLKVIRFFERWSSPRWAQVMGSRILMRFFGLVILLFAIFAFIAPPFSGLDTVPSLGIVIVSLAIILDDFLIFIIGFIVGSAGIALIVGLSGVVFNFLRTF